MKCWRQLLGNKLWVIPKHFSGFPCLRQAELWSMMTKAVVESSSTPEMIERVRQIICEDRHHTTYHKILTEDLQMWSVALKFVPRLLSVDQKQQRLDVCLDLKENAANDPNFLSNVITGDETWVYACHPETKTQSSQWKSPGSPRPKKARQSKWEVNFQVSVDLFLWSEGNCSQRICSSWSNS